MVESNGKTLESLLKQVKINAEKAKETLYARHTEEITSIQLIDIFKLSRDLNEKRTFWHSYSDNFTSVGIGEKAIISNQDDSCEEINHAWKELINKTTIHNTYKEIGSGMLAMGGLT